MAIASRILRSLHWPGDNRVQKLGHQTQQQRMGLRSVLSVEKGRKELCVRPGNGVRGWGDADVPTRGARLPDAHEAVGRARP
jgi:hypothetical protein